MLRDIDTWGMRLAENYTTQSGEKKNAMLLPPNPEYLLPYLSLKQPK